MGAPSFREVLRRLRTARGVSCNALGRTVGVDPSYLTRIESGDREPPRQHIVEALARTLQCSSFERDQLFAAAGYLPPVLDGLGWDPILERVADTLVRLASEPARLSAFRQALVGLTALARRDQ